MNRALITVLAAAVLSGCVLGPNTRPAPTPAAASGPFVSATSPAVFAGTAPPDQWWRLYDDPAIDALVMQALAANTDLRVANANLKRARAVLSESRAARLPTTTVNAEAQYERYGGALSSGATFGAGSSAAATPRPVFQSPFYSVGLDASYEIDLFGRVTRLIQAARADADALAAARDAVMVSVAAETTRAYADACASQRQLVVAQQSIDIQAQSFALTERLYAAGRGTPLDTSRARAQLESTRATLPQFVASRQSALYRLAVLTGRPPEEVPASAVACTQPPVLKQALPVGDGAALLRRRPDIRQADRNYAAATARIGVAKAAVFPTVSLGGAVTSTAFSTEGIGSAQSFAYNIGPLISWSFPNIAVANARIRQTRAAEESALASFDGTVLTALQETEIALSAYASELDRHRTLVSARDLNGEAARIVRLRYAAGRENFLAVLDAERSLATAEAALAQSDAALSDDQVSVFKALGGGWQTVPAQAGTAQAGPAQAGTSQAASGSGSNSASAVRN